jgi:type IV secretory pathway ATPase VirB11/archaellum biosynthesis ATPase
MNNIIIFQNYKQDILNVFKAHYRKIISQNTNVSFDFVLTSTLKELKIYESDNEQVSFLEEWFNLVHNQSFLTRISSLYQFNELIFHGPSDIQIINGKDRASLEINLISEEDYQLALEVLSLKNSCSWNYSEPFSSFQTKIQDTSCRITLIHFSTSANAKSKVFLRSLFNTSLSLNNFCDNPELIDFVREITLKKKNILIAGSTGCGKTTFLRALLSETDQDEHIIILEDTHEIFTTSSKQTSFLAREKTGKKSLKEYCAYALRMSPDRLILGEMRSDEVVPFLLAMNTGHNGLMSTIHANSSVDSISRLALLFSMYSGNNEMSFELITKLICKNIDYIIYLKDKTIDEVCKVIGSEKDIPFFEKIY